MVVLTTIIALSAFWQARLAKRADERQRLAQSPRLSVHPFVSERTTRRTEAVGFVIRNDSLIDVAIIEWELECGVGREGPATRSLILRASEEPDLPCWLRHGETTTVRFYPLLLAQALIGAELTGGSDDPRIDQTPRFRPSCLDSFGNTYRAEPWVQLHSEGKRPSFHAQPGSGYITPEERARLDKGRLGRLRDCFPVSWQK